MNADSDNEAGFEVGRRRTPPSSRETSPVAKRQRRSFTPTSDDDGVVVPVVQNEDAETPPPENTPLIRQAVGFSWTPSTSTSVSTYQAAAAQQPAFPCFLPGQVPPPPKPKPTKPRAPRRKKVEQFSDKITRFRLSDPTLQPSPPSGTSSPSPLSTGNSASLSPSSGVNYTTPDPSSSMTPPINHASAPTPSHINGSILASSLGSKRSRKSSKRRAPSARRSPTQPAVINTVTPQYPVNNSPGDSQTPDSQSAHSAASGSPPAGHTNATSNQGPAQGVSKPTRMVTLLIEDLRSGVADAQLAEVRVPLKIADDPDDGFWADAVEICNALQIGPSRIDGPAKVYTMRGRFRQFFMRVDELDQVEVQSAHLGVSKERTLSVYVETPVPQGQLPRPPAAPANQRPGFEFGSECDTMTSPTIAPGRPTYHGMHEVQAERSSRNHHVHPDRRVSPGLENESCNHPQRIASPDAWHGLPRRDPYPHSNRPLLTPPIPGRHADSQDEKDEAIANYIRSDIENHPGWMDYMQSKAKPQRVSEVLKQYDFVQDRVREHTGRKTPPHWDGAPNCYVEKHHIWRVLKLTFEWGGRCQEVLRLVTFYGKNGARYEDSRVTDMINDTSPPKANVMDKFLRLLHVVDEVFIQESIAGNLASIH